MAAVANRNRKKNFARVDGQSGDTFVPPQEEERGRNVSAVPRATRVLVGIRGADKTVQVA